MKRMGRLTMLLMIFAMPARAQSQDRLPGPGTLEEIGDLPGTRENSAGAILNFRDQLNLSDEQVERVRQVLESDREARDTHRLEVRGLRDQLRDGEITQEEFREKMEMRRSDIGEDRLRNRERLQGILSEEQRTQMQDLRRQARQGGVRGDRSHRRQRAMRRGRGAARTNR